MRHILWVELPESANDRREEIEELFGKEFKDDPDLQIIVTYGEIKLHLFGRPLFVYPYWLLKIKLWLTK